MMDSTRSLPDEKKSEKASSRRSAEEGTCIDVDASYLIDTGYQPQLKRSFTLFSMFSASFTVTNSWLGVTGGFSTGISVGGPATLIYGLIISAVFNLALVISLGELMSSMPNAGGQYYWAMQLAPKKLARFSAYVCGVCNLLGPLTGVASGAVGIAYMLLGCVQLTHPEFEIKAWHAFLIATAFILLTSLGNLSESIVVKSVIIGLWFCILSCVVIAVVPASVSRKHSSIGFIFNNTDNNSGWTSTGMAFLVGMINSNYAFALLDAGVHLAEEIPEPEKNVPKALLMAVGVGFVTAWPMSVSILNCITDFELVSTTPTGVPLLELFYRSLRNSKIGAIIMQLLVVISYFWCLVAVETYQSRVYWSFSRDNGLPFSKYLSRVRNSVPLNAHMLCTVLSIILSSLCLATTSAFNSLITGVICFPYISVLIPVAFSLLPRNKNVPKGPFHLGKLGTVARLATVVYCIFTTIVYSFPYYMPATSNNMNYFSVVVAIVMFYIAIDWFLRARKDFHKKED